MAQTSSTTWESFINKTFKMKNPGVHGEFARYTVEGVMEMDFGRNEGGKQPAFKVKRLDPPGEFTRACSVFKKQFVEAIDIPEEEEDKPKDLSPTAIDKRLSKVEEKLAKKE